MTINSYRSPSIQDIDIDEQIREKYDAGLEAFREIVINSCKMNRENEITDEAAALPLPGYFVISNFSRQVLGQTGDGHFSPIGGILCYVYLYSVVFVMGKISVLTC